MSVVDSVNDDLCESSENRLSAVMNFRKAIIVLGGSVVVFIFAIV